MFCKGIKNSSFQNWNLNTERKDSIKFDLFTKKTMEDMFSEELYCLLPKTFNVLMSHSSDFF